jgi:hypothetical protein
VNRITTTAWNGYGEHEYRAFKYLTPKLRLEERDLSDEQVLARSFHMVCSPGRCISLVDGILNRRREVLRARGIDPDGVDEEALRPVFVWEPVPDLCTPEELLRLRDAAGHVDVVSPNAEEFASFFQGMPDCEARERHVQWLLRVGNGGSILNGEEQKALKTMLVIREGAQGCTTYTARNMKGLHLRAHHQSSTKVVDPTGGGNTFLGALAIGLAGTTTPEESIIEDLDVPMDQKRLLLALIHSTVAAGYAIEQIGMPSVLATDGDSWNGERYPDRFVEYFEREREHIISQLSQNEIEP